MYVFDEMDQEKKTLIFQHLELVIQANKTTNLTRIDTIEDALLLHVEDSLMGLKELDEAPNGMFGDIGSGAGYPGIPLSIVSGRKVLLIDSRKKKMDIVEGIVKDLGLSKQIEVYAGRAELLARKRKGIFSAVTARALAKLSVLMELASPLLMKDGILICYKAQLSDEEYEEASMLQNLLSMKICSDRSFVLSDGNTNRRIVCFRKTGDPKVKLPRLEGAAQKNPLRV